MFDSDSSDSDDNNKQNGTDIIEAMRRKSKHRHQKQNGSNKKAAPQRTPKRSVSPLANHPTFVRLKREREIEEKETEEDSSYPTSKKYKSETFARRFRTMSLDDNRADNLNLAYYIKQLSLPMNTNFALDIDSDDTDDDDSDTDDENGNDYVIIDNADYGNCTVNDGTNVNSNSSNKNGYQDDPYTIHQFEKFQKRHQHSLSSSPLHRMASTVSSLDGTVTTVTISDDKTSSTVITTIQNDDDDDDGDDDEDEDEDIDDDLCESKQCSSSNSSCSGNGSCTGSDK